MPIKKDDTGKRWVEMELVVPGTPQELWHAVATGPGCSGWFTSTTIEERIGGRICFDLGSYGTSTGEVTIWEPPYRFGYVEREWNENAPPVETEISIASRSDGKSLFRMTHSLVAATDDWDASLESFENGWPGFFDVLKIYLSHFSGSNAASFHVMTSTIAPQSEVWKRLTEAIGLAAANVGDQRTTSTSPQELSCLIERVHQSDHERYLLVRITAPCPGIGLIGTFGTSNATNASVILYFYGNDAERSASRSKELWTAWLTDLLKETSD